MTKKNMLKSLDAGSYFSLIIASVLVLLYEFIGEILIMRFSIILFGAAFLILCVLSTMKLVFMKNETKENDELLVDKTKEKKSWIIVRLVFGSIFFALMITFLCLF